VQNIHFKKTGLKPVFFCYKKSSKLVEGISNQKKSKKE